MSEPTTVVLCHRCGLEKERLPEPPVGGELGERIANEICADCWTEWSETSTRLINHYQLVLGNPTHRSQLRSAMKQFLGFEAEPAPEHHHDHQHQHDHDHAHEHGSTDS